MRVTELRLAVIKKLLDEAKHSLMEGNVRNALELAFRAYEGGVDILNSIKEDQALKQAEDGWDAIIKRCSTVMSRVSESSSPSENDVEDLVACAEETIALAETIHRRK
jgi:hypothetical protein